MNIINNILSYLSQSTLMFMGWSPLNEQYIDMIQNHKQMVCVFSHTSYFDFCIMVLYKLAYPQYFSNMKTLINAYYFKFLGRFLKSVVGIAAAEADKVGGCVERIVNILKQRKEFMFLISPKGTILRKEWKSGYYHIAKQLNTPIVAVGLDYEKKMILIGKPISNQLDEPIIKNKLYKDLSHIVPLHPKQENMMIRKHVYNDVSVINSVRLLMLYMIMLSYYTFK